EALGVGVRLRSADRRVEHPYAFAAENLVEGGGELAVTVVDQKPHSFEQTSEAEVARLLCDPSAGRVGGAAREGDAAARAFDEEEHVEAAQRDRFDGEEIAGKHARGLLAEELAPAGARAPRRGPKTVAKQDPPHRARRDAQAELEQLARNAGIAPTRILPREP